MLIDGKAIAAELIKELRATKKSFTGKKVLSILVGNNPASLNFLERKGRVAEELGVSFSIQKIAPEISETALIAEVKKLTEDERVIGAIVQLPIPVKNVDVQKVLDAVPYEKDIDCLGEKRLREFFKNPLSAVIFPPAVSTVRRILSCVGIADVRGKRITVYGFGRLVGKPVAAWVEASGANVTVLRRNSTQEEVTTALGGSDIIVTGVGQKNLVNVEAIRPGSVVIDFGFPADIDANAAHTRGIIVTPTPGGTGPVLIAELFKNLYTLN